MRGPSPIDLGASSSLGLKLRTGPRSTSVFRSPTRMASRSRRASTSRLCCCREAVRAEPAWAMSLHQEGWTELSTLDAVVCAQVLAPIMSDLAGIFRCRAGDGPQSAKGKAEKLLRCREAHQALGLRSDPGWPPA